MRIDPYTKAVLTVIALLLAVIAFKEYINPDSTAHAQGAFAGVQYSGPIQSFFDTRTGEVYEYRGDGGLASGSQLTRQYRLVKLGQPLVKEK